MGVVGWESEVEEEVGRHALFCASCSGNTGKVRSLPWHFLRDALSIVYVKTGEGK